MKNIVLIGMPGSGKSSAAKMFSQKFSYNLIDLDQLIQKTTSKKIFDIFSERGENYFRQCEHSLLKKISPFTKSVIALGGGIVVWEKNHPFIKNIGIVIYLFCKPKLLYDNLLNNYFRPNIHVSISSLKNLLSHRHNLYLKNADWVLDCSNLSVNDIVNQLSYFR